MKSALRVVLTLVMCMFIAGITFAEDVKPKGVLRAGLGISFGGIGLNYEQPLHKRISVYAGLGYVADAKQVGWATGAKLYIDKDKGRNIRLYLVGLYGIVEKERDAFTYNTWEKKTGIKAGIGFGKRAWQVEFFYDKGSITTFPSFGWAIK